jgi:hypothetical protein
MANGPTDAEIIRAFLLELMQKAQAPQPSGIPKQITPNPSLLGILGGGIKF